MDLSQILHVIPSVHAVKFRAVTCKVFMFNTVRHVFLPRNEWFLPGKLSTLSFPNERYSLNVNKASSCEDRFFAFTNNGRVGKNSISFFWESFPGGTRWLREGRRDLLRLLTILETMTNHNKVGSNVDLFCKHH